MKNGLVLTVTITKTATGEQDYIQIMSADMLSVNVVVVADRIEVTDHRVPARPVFRASGTAPRGSK